MTLSVACSDAPDGEAGAEPNGPNGIGGKADTAAGLITDIQCSPSDTFIRPGGVAKITVDAQDANGIASRNYEVSVTPAFGARVVQRNKVIVDVEGSYDIKCCARDSGKCDVTAVQVGRADPALAVAATPFVDDGLVRLTGRALAQDGSLPRVTVDGKSLDLDSNGRFGAILPANWGANQYTLVATDSTGRQSTRHAWTIAGPFQSLNTSNDDAVLVGLSPSAFAQISDLLGRGLVGYLATPDFKILLQETHAGEVGGRRFEITPQILTITEPKFELSAESGGLRISADLRGIRLVLDAGADAPLAGWVQQIAELRIARFALAGLMKSNGDHLSLEQITVELDGLEFELSGLPDFVTNVVLSLFEDTIRDIVRENVVAQAETHVQGVLLGFAREIPIALPEPLWGTLTATLGLSSVTANTDGLQVGLSWEIDGDTDPRRAKAPGYPAFGGVWTARLQPSLFSVVRLGCGQLDVLRCVANRRA